MPSYSAESPYKKGVAIITLQLLVGDTHTVIAEKLHLGALIRPNISPIRPLSPPRAVGQYNIFS